jgi:cell wall assembly regulator SMI1
MAWKKMSIAIAVVLSLVLLSCGLLPMAARWGMAARMYPPAPKMPAIVPETPEKLLARFEQLLREKAPRVLAALQPGLSDAQIDALQTKGKFVLPPDLRALYRWRNGTPRDSDIDVFADHRFAPLDEAVADRDTLRYQVRSQGYFARQVFGLFAGHRQGWLGLIVDLAGDGYFFDPDRPESGGSFFFCFLEDGTYIFFPSVRNFLAATVEGHNKGVFKFGTRGAETADFARSFKLWEDYGAFNR